MFTYAWRPKGKRRPHVRPPSWISHCFTSSRFSSIQICRFECSLANQLASINVFRASPYRRIKHTRVHCWSAGCVTFDPALHLS